MSDYGLGAIQSPPDERDYPIKDLYRAVSLSPPIAVPDSYQVPGLLPPVLDQDGTPQCVAYSSAFLKLYEDRIDQGAFFPFDEARFFAAIGGGPGGAVVRTAFDVMRRDGYPLTGGVGAAQHKIAAYYAVPLTKDAIQAALITFGPVIFATPWYNSWFTPGPGGVLPAPSGGVAGGHAIAGPGWGSAKGVRWRNSWGPLWGDHGDCYLPWEYLGNVWEVWKAVDVIEAPTATYTLHVAASAKVLLARLASTGCISGWDTHQWGTKASSAPCRAPVLKRGCSSGSATVAYVTAGVFAGRWVRLGSGVTVTRNP